MSEKKNGIINKKKASKILGIQFSILSPEEIVKKSVAEIMGEKQWLNIGYLSREDLEKFR